MSYTKISIIALGETGSGKSLFCKLFSGSETFFSKKATESVTTEINSITFKNEKKKVEIFLIDTPGSNDSRGIEQDKQNLILTQKFISEQPRINCIILVMNIQNPRFTDSIKRAIKNICQCFPLPDFWTHVIIFWTHCKFEDEEDEKEQIENIETDVKQSFITLSEEIENELHINKIQENQTLNMIYNEYNENSRNEALKKKNYEKSQRNFEKIINLVKDMKPLYEIVYPPEEKDVLQEPKEGRIVGNSRQFTYNKIRTRKYKDFNNPEIIQNEEIFGTYLVNMQENESDWELSENRENNKVYIKYIIRTFYDEQGNELNSIDIIDINFPLKEKLREKIVTTQTKEEIMSNNRKKIYKVDSVYYPDINKIVEENKIFIKEIEEGETDWEEDPNFNQSNIVKYNKYKTKTEFDEYGNKVGNTVIDKENIVDWKKIETRIEDNVRIIVTDKVTKVIKRTTKIETKKNDENPRIIDTQEEQISLERIEEELIPVNNLDSNNLGTIEYNWYNVKYINDVRMENEKTKIESKSYVEAYKQSDEKKIMREKRDQYEYKIIYNAIYMIDSRYPTVKRETGFRIILEENIINLIMEEEVKERFENNNVIKQKYNVYYILNSDGNKIEDHRDKNGEEITEEIQYGDEYPVIEKPMTLEKINELKSRKEYPINFVYIYYKDEINTIRKDKKKIKTENVEIKMEENRYVIKNIPDKNLIINNEFNELIFINGEYTKTISNHSQKRYDLLFDSDEEEVIEREQIIKLKTVTWYYIDENNQKNIADTEVTQNTEDIIYEEEYSEIKEPMTLEKIKQLKEEKKYPIYYEKIYYKKEKNTRRKWTKKRTENVAIEMGHKRYNTINKEDKYIIIHDIYNELIYINGTFSNEIPNENQNRKELLIKTTNQKRDEKNYIANIITKIYYYIDDNHKEIEVDKDVKEEKEDIEYGNEYSEIESPMTLDKINKLKNEKKYPINYEVIFYQDELNTVRKGRKKTRKEKVEIKMTHKTYNQISSDKKQIIINDDYLELIYINEVLTKENPIHNEKKYNILKKRKIDIRDGQYRITKIITNTFYYINDNHREIEVDKDIREEEEDIEYGYLYSEIESPMTLDKINKLKSEKNYPIMYKLIYYQNEINTNRKSRKRIRTENIELILEHKKDTFPTDDKRIIKVDEYDIEKTFINGKISQTSGKLNIKSYKESNILETHERLEKVKTGFTHHLFGANEHSFDIYKVITITYKIGETDTITSFQKSVVDRYD